MLYSYGFCHKELQKFQRGKTLIIKIRELPPFHDYCVKEKPLEAEPESCLTYIYMRGETPSRYAKWPNVHVYIPKSQ